MSGQMNLLAPPSEGPVEVPLCRSVLHSGASAHAEDRRGEPLFTHRHLPPVPSELDEEAHWLAALDFAESEIRFKYPTRAILDLQSASGSGCSGGKAGLSQPTLMASSRGIEVDGHLVGWPRLLGSRQEQREVEFDLARARDLAHAYHLLDYYGAVYGEPEERDGFDGIGEQFSPVPLIRELAEEALALGGDPALLTSHTTYMREGIAAACGPPPRCESPCPRPS
jgi:hypothetical protein